MHRARVDDPHGEFIVRTSDGWGSDAGALEYAAAEASALRWASGATDDAEESRDALAEATDEDAARDVARLAPWEGGPPGRVGASAAARAGATLGSEAAWLRESTDARAHPLFAGMERVALATGVQLRVLQRLPQTASFARRFASIGVDEDDSDEDPDENPDASESSSSESSSAWRLAFTPAALASASSRRRRETAAMERAADDAIASMAATRARRTALARRRETRETRRRRRASRRVGIARRGGARVSPRRVRRTRRRHRGAARTREVAESRGGGGSRREGERGVPSGGGRGEHSRRVGAGTRRRGGARDAETDGKDGCERDANAVERDSNAVDREDAAVFAVALTRGRRVFSRVVFSHPRVGSTRRVRGRGGRVVSNRRRRARVAGPILGPVYALSGRDDAIRAEHARGRRGRARRRETASQGTRRVFATTKTPGSPDLADSIESDSDAFGVDAESVLEDAADLFSTTREDPLETPFPVTLAECVSRVVLDRHRVVSRLVTAAVLDHLGAETHAAAVGKYILCGAGDFSSVLVEGVEAAARADAARGGWGATSHALRDALHAAVKESAASADPLAARARFARVLRPSRDSPERTSRDSTVRLSANTPRA